jgi:hypothetical protein
LRGASVLGGGAVLAMSQWPLRIPAALASSRRGIVHVLLFSNFEGWSQDPEPTVSWFEDCSLAHPQVRWTHLYNPWHLIMTYPEVVATEAGFSPYLLDRQRSGKAEIGVHLHMFYDLVAAMGVTPRAYPFATDTSPGCDYPRAVAEDPLDGYDGLLTAYTPAEQATILDASIRAFLKRGFRRPRTFCAGYSATDPALQVLLVKKGFRASFAAQIGPYGDCWDQLVAWSGNITPLTMPYRVSRSTILPPPHVDPKHLGIVEIPLNMGVDSTPLSNGNQVVSRVDMFDRHFDWATTTKGETAVAIGVHADVIANETWGSGASALVFEEFLSHVEERASLGGAEVRFSTASKVATRFRRNTTIGSVP